MVWLTSEQWLFYPIAIFIPDILPSRYNKEVNENMRKYDPGLLPASEFCVLYIWNFPPLKLMVPVWAIPIWYFIFSFLQLSCLKLFTFRVELSLGWKHFVAKKGNKIKWVLPGLQLIMSIIWGVQVLNSIHLLSGGSKKDRHRDQGKKTLRAKKLSSNRKGSRSLQTILFTQR